MPTREQIAAIVPPFGLQVSWGALELRIPDDDELLELADVAADGVYADPEVPHRFAWTRGTPQQVRRNVVTHLWETRGQIDPASWRLTFALFEDGRLRGVQAISAREYAVSRDAETGSWIGSKYQGQSLGRKMRLMILHLAFEHLGALSMRTRAYVDNPASNVVSRRLGYEINGVQDVARGTERVQDALYRMTLDRWQQRPAELRPPITVTGAAAVRDLFGITGDVDDTIVPGDACTS